MKYYIQNGYEKRILQASNYRIALKTFFKELIKPNKSGEEICALSTTTLVSPVGFVQDLMDAEMHKELSEVKRIRTSKFFDTIKRKDIGNFLRKCEKKNPKELRDIEKKAWNG